MKKITAIFLATLMIFSALSVTAFAAKEKKEKCPIIFIAGSSVDFVDKDGKPIETGIELLTEGDGGDGVTKDKIIESTVNIIIPFLTQGLPEDKWDEYGDALYNELSPIWEETQLDANGNSKGVQVAPEEIAYWDNIASTVDHGADGTFGINDYKFRYDWRLSPYDHVDRLHQFIKTVIKTTGCSQVALVGRCLGGNIVTAYLDAYGSEGLVKKVVYDEVMSNGSSSVNDCFSGQIDISDRHVQSYVLASEHFGKKDVGIDLNGVNNLVLEMVENTLDFANQIGLTEGILSGVEDLYDRLYAAFMPAVLKATGLATWPSYWTSVSDKNFDTALNLLYGKEGSEERAEYKGLVDKILNLRERIVKPRELKGDQNLYKVFENKYNVGIAVICGYGIAIPPLGVHHDDTGDITVDTRSSSLGATTAGLFGTLSQDYIDERIAAGYDDYISPDGKIDASTCLFPETTWFVKNKHHDTGAGWATLSEYYTQYTNVTASSNNRNISRFLVADLENFSSISNMTKDNMSDGPWLKVTEEEPTTESIFASFIRFMKTLFQILTQIFKGDFSFSI